jgi:fructuronate reductase
MKLRILNMSHSTIAGVGVLLGHRGTYGIYKAMQDCDVASLIGRIIDIVLHTVAHPKQMAPSDFARDALERLNNPNIPDDPMRIAFNGSTKMRPRFLDTYFAGLEKGIPADTLDIVLVPVAGFLRYSLGIDDAGKAYQLESDPLKSLLVKCGATAQLGDQGSSQAFRPLISHADIMGRDLYGHSGIGQRLQKMAGEMLEGQGAVRKTVKRYLQGK